MTTVISDGSKEKCQHVLVNQTLIGTPSVHTDSNLGEGAPSFPNSLIGREMPSPPAVRETSHWVCQLPLCYYWPARTVKAEPESCFLRRRKSCLSGRCPSHRPWWGEPGRESRGVSTILYSDYLGMYGSGMGRLHQSSATYDLLLLNDVCSNHVLGVKSVFPSNL